MALTQTQKDLQKKRDLRTAQARIKTLVQISVEQNTPVKTGALRISTHLRIRGVKVYIEQKYYGLFVNFGTRYITARKFIQRAIRQVIVGGIRSIERQFGLKFEFYYFGRRVG